MYLFSSRDRLILVLTVLVVLFAPILIMASMLGLLILTGDLVLGRITPIEFLELYVIELVLFVVFAYGIYRLTIWLVEHRLPASIAALEARQADEAEQEESSDDNRDSIN
jgi:hypothetical protein